MGASGQQLQEHGQMQEEEHTKTAQGLMGGSWVKAILAPPWILRGKEKTGSNTKERSSGLGEEKNMATMHLP